MASLPADPLLTRTSNRVRTARRLARRVSRAEHRLFLAEGRQAVIEALRTPGVVREVFVAGSAHDDLVAAYPDVTWLRATDDAVASLSDTVTPQGLVAVCRFLEADLASVVAARPRLVAVCVDVRDPGNAGTVIRCADAAGADAVVLAGESVDPYNAKVVRSTAGSLFHLPLALQRDPGELVARLRAAGLLVLATSGEGDLDLDDAADSGVLTRPTAWLFGNEAHGLPPELLAAADHRVRIPLHGRAESLNLATAAAVCLYASAREQRPRSGSASAPEVGRS